MPLPPIDPAHAQYYVIMDGARPVELYLNYDDGASRAVARSYAHPAVADFDGLRWEPLADRDSAAQIAGGLGLDQADCVASLEHRVSQQMAGH